jgi:glycopeptide antibiotics resistance protein
MARRVLFAGWVAVILAAVVPWWDMQNHTHWSKVQWIPFLTPPIKPLDLIGNVLLYLPFGVLFPTRRDASWWRWPVAVALGLSIVTEWTQLYSHWRFPSFTDVTCNVIGAAIGARLSRWRGTISESAAP